MTTVWIAQRAGTVTECHGIFSTREKAVSACRTDHDWIAPMTVDVRAPEEPTAWEGVEWPLQVGPPIDWDGPAAPDPAPREAAE